MPETTLPEEVDAHAIDNPTYWAAIFQDLQEKMTPTAADEAIGVQAGTIAAAIKRREIKPYQFSERKVYVTPCLLGMWAYKNKRRFRDAQTS